MFERFRKWMNFNPPPYGTGDEWDKFHQRFEADAPVRHWVYKNKLKLRAKIQRAMRIFDEIRYRIVRYHVVNTGLRPGYYDKDTLMLHANFSLLVDYVERELAFQQEGQAEIDERILGKKIWRRLRHKVPFYTTYREMTFRSRELGLEHLLWETGLDDKSLPKGQRNPSQAKSAREIRDLYFWWKDDRPNRTPPELDADVRELIDSQSIFYAGSPQMQKDHPVLAQKYYVWMQEYSSFDAYCEIEDEEKLMQLIKLRKSLWT